MTGEVEKYNKINSVLAYYEMFRNEEVGISVPLPLVLFIVCFSVIIHLSFTFATGTALLFTAELVQPFLAETFKHKLPFL